MTIPRRRLAAALTITILAASGGQALAQGPLAEARALYAAAAYEDALSVLAKVDPATGDRGEAEQYRAFCLIALGRTADAERAIESVVTADPLFVPKSAEVSPRILAMFTDVRRRILPEIARRSYLEGRSAYQAKEFAAATSQLDRSIRVIEQAKADGGPEMEDLQILVSGFLDLARAAAERPLPKASERTPATAPAGPGAAGPAAAASRPQPSAAAESYTGPVAIRQEMPSWNPPTAGMAGREYVGTVKVVIGPDGRVVDAAVVKPVHPLYDPLVLQAARMWTYRPATRSGEPTTAVKFVEIRLTPR
jgi:tetratricopeptide (TPR) repeat protein